MRHLLCAMIVCAVPALPHAEEVSLLAGHLSIEQSDGRERSFAANLGYTYRFGEHAAVSAEYINEGHPTFHHRDGLASQFWARTATPERGFSFGVGAGPYFYFDTTTGSGQSTDYRNEHGWGALMSVNARWHLASHWFAEFRASRIFARGQHDSIMTLVGLGYDLQDLPLDTALKNAARGRNLVSVSAGRVIVNSFASERTSARAAEFRRALTPNADWSVSWLDEGGQGAAHRRGAAAQLWLVHPVTERLVLNIGGGVYAAEGNANGDSARTHTLPLASVGLRFALSPQWRAHLTWNRVMTPYHRDADVFLWGVGATF